ncbi:hypothetical protein OP10G_3993 [Fimbriimonas ginsengisoli Gsoil 348]|uniref:Uncharacterized protein n=1 Tax=Fimbriimonas ginsengisoli Gsoil 348 TaxID=661478 RepID=A0A068NV85_FIMGI|nr:hypothetical protein OP10G_3993 [Fimbriimonas ginsengisoli Gsoil 348]
MLEPFKFEIVKFLSIMPCKPIVLALAEISDFLQSRIKIPEAGVRSRLVEKVNRPPIGERIVIKEF